MDLLRSGAIWVHLVGLAPAASLNQSQCAELAMNFTYHAHYSVYAHWLKCLTYILALCFGPGGLRDKRKTLLPFCLPHCIPRKYICSDLIQQTSNIPCRCFIYLLFLLGINHWGAINMPQSVASSPGLPFSYQKYDPSKTYHMHEKSCILMGMKLLLICASSKEQAS